MKIPQKLITKLRHLFAGSCKAQPTKEDALRKILFVGAKVEDNELTVTDGHWLHTSLNILQSFHVPLACDFEIEIINIDPAQGGEDFLDGAHRGDIVITSWLYHPSETYAPRSRRTGNFALSPRHDTPRIWHESFMKTGAKVLVVNGDEKSLCLPESYFYGPELEKIVKNSKNMDARNPYTSLFARTDYLQTQPYLMLHAVPTTELAHNQALPQPHLTR